MPESILLLKRRCVFGKRSSSVNWFNNSLVSSFCNGRCVNGLSNILRFVDFGLLLLLHGRAIGVLQFRGIFNGPSVTFRLFISVISLSGILLTFGISTILQIIKQLLIVRQYTVLNWFWMFTYLYIVSISILSVVGCFRLCRLFGLNWLHLLRFWEGRIGRLRHWSVSYLRYVWISCYLWCISYLLGGNRVLCRTDICYLRLGMRGLITSQRLQCRIWVLLLSLRVDLRLRVGLRLVLEWVLLLLLLLLLMLLLLLSVVWWGEVLMWVRLGLSWGVSLGLGVCLRLGVSLRLSRVLLRGCWIDLRTWGRLGRWRWWWPSWTRLVVVLRNGICNLTLRRYWMLGIDEWRQAQKSGHQRELKKKCKSTWKFSSYIKKCLIIIL